MLSKNGQVEIRCLVVLSCAIVAGCALDRDIDFEVQPANFDFHAVATAIEYPDSSHSFDSVARHSQAPRTVDQEAPSEYWELTLNEVIAYALTHSEVINDLGGRVLTNPDGVTSVYDPSLRESDPRFGPEGALSAFDTRLSTSMFWSKNDRAVNNIITAGGARQVRQDLGTFQFQLDKTGAAGTQLRFRNQTEYDQNNQPGNLFFSGWTSEFELSVTQPLLQGAGVKFNRIAGPNNQPGLTGSTTGVLLARINTDISIADFELRVRDFVSELEDAYWDLYFAYRDFDAKIVARDSAYEAWRRSEALLQADAEGGDASREAQARQQYFEFRSQAIDTLNGSPNAGQSAGVFRSERRLRLLMGLPPADGLIIRPADAPPEMKVVFWWEDLLHEALVRRVELRRQYWQIKRRELELIGARNFLLPRFDAVALYRFRGFGDDLTGGNGRFGSAMNDLSSGDHQEWQLGLQFNYEFGYRRQWAGVRQAELQLARDVAVLKDQELAISHGLGDAYAEVIRAHEAVSMRFNALGSAIQWRDATAAKLDAQPDRVPLDFLLRAQQTVADAQTRYHLALSQYARAIKNVHLQKGTLLQYHNIHLSESEWPAQAYADAFDIQQRWQPSCIDYRCQYPGPISAPPMLPFAGPDLSHEPQLGTESTDAEVLEEIPTPAATTNTP